LPLDTQLLLKSQKTALKNLPRSRSEKRTWSRSKYC
jgi:hypothetical protein